MAFICDRGGVPQLSAGPVDGEGIRLLDPAPGSREGGVLVTRRPLDRVHHRAGRREHSRVLCVRPVGTGRRLLAGTDPDTSAHLDY